MALSKFTDDTDIIQGLSNKPNEIEGLTPDQLKKKFDDNAINLKAYLNETLTAEQDASNTALSSDISSLQSGWINTDETWAYSSVDDPTGVITINGDKTSKYSIGMRIKFTNNSNIIYGIITKISYSDLNTTLTFLHEINPSNSQALYLMQNSTITNNYYSIMKDPYGFPCEVTKWAVFYSTTTTVSQSTPTQNIWYNIDNRKLDVPIGSWYLSYSIPIDDLESSGTAFAFNSTLHTTNNNVNTSLICGTQQTGGGNYMEINHDSNTLLVNLTSKTSYYLNVKTQLTTCSRLRYGSWKVFRIQAVCAYL